MINNNNTTNLFINQKAIVVDVINKENNNNIQKNSQCNYRNLFHVLYIFIKNLKNLIHLIG